MWPGGFSSQTKLKPGSWLWPRGPHLVRAWFSCPVRITHSHTICSASLFTKAVARTAPSAGSDLSPIVWATCAPNNPLCDLSMASWKRSALKNEQLFKALFHFMFPLCMYPYMKITYMVCTGLCCDSHISVWTLEVAYAFPFKVFSLVYKILPATM